VAREVAATRSAVDRFREMLATGLGLGLAPIAPGTFGSLPGVALAWGLAAVGGWPTLLAGAVVVAGAGIWAAEGVARRLGRDDPGEVVVDEVAGQMVTLLGLPPSPLVLVAAFLLFRLLDIVKPFPARSLEALPGGLGIMVDDLVAGAYACAILHGLLWCFPGLVGGM
jgi:phosphatidylglycerophosphatase A